jgi:AsmA-like C-terminal region
VRWPTPDRVPHGRGVTSDPQPAEIHFTRLDLPDGSLPGDGVGIIAALAPSASLAVDELNWRGRSLGRLTATVASKDQAVSVEDAHLVNRTQDAHGVLHCQTAAPTCRLKFVVDSTDAATTLEDFGFKPDLTASSASLNGEVEWHSTSGQPWLAGVQGTVTMRLADGTLRNSSDRALQSPLAGLGNPDTLARDTLDGPRDAPSVAAAAGTGAAGTGAGRHGSAPVARNGIREAAAAPFATLTDIGDGAGDAHDLNASPTNADTRSAVEAPPTDADKRFAVEASPTNADKRSATARASSRSSALASVETSVGSPTGPDAPTRNGLDVTAADVGSAAVTDVWSRTAAASDADNARPQPFALLAVPALVSALDAPGAAGSSLTKQQPALHFDHLEADFDLADGQATTSNLHFDGDAEILMRGRIGIVSRDYDQQVWLLRGEERLPAAVRRFGATPRVAAAWLSLRDLFGGGGSHDRSRAVLRLQGTWDDPMVVTAN